MNSGRQALWMVLIIGVMSLSGWYFAHSRPIIKLDSATLDNMKDAEIFHIFFKQYDENGRLKVFIRAPRLHHVPNNDTYYFEKPYIELAQENAPFWVITADHGYAYQQIHHIDFNENVRIHQNAFKHHLETTIKTQHLTYFPSNKFAMTQDDISLQQSDKTVYSQGLKANLDTKMIELLHNARGVYEPAMG